MTSWQTVAPEATAPAGTTAVLDAVADADERFDLAQHRAALRRARLRRIGLGTVGLVVVLGLWQLIAVC